MRFCFTFGLSIFKILIVEALWPKLTKTVFMVDKLLGFWSLIENNIYKLSSLEINQIKYEDPDLSYKLGLVLLAVILFKWLLGFVKPRTSHKESGHSIYESYDQGFLTKLRYFVPKFLLLPLIVVFLFILAGPFLTQLGETEEIVQSRIRIDVRDASTSMENLFFSSSKSKAEVAVESHLEFIKMRRGKKDRVTFWLFASNPHMMQEFTIDDDELYYLQAYDAPWITWSGNIEDWFLKNPGSKTLVPKNRYVSISGEGGGTNIEGALRAITKYLNEDNVAKKAREGAILIMTDADVFKFPEEELKILQSRHIVPYVIYIANQNYDDDGFPIDPVVPEFALRIRDYGGKFFDVRDGDSLKKAYQEIDKLEKAETKISRYTLKIDLFHIILPLAVSVLFTLIFIGLLVELVWLRHP